MSTITDFSKEYARKLDQKDTLGSFRSEFYLQDTIYLDGNSLGLLSKRAESTLLKTVEAWKTLGIDGWTNGEHPWFYMSENLGHQLAPLIGADPDEVVVTGSTTTNLHQLISSFYKPTAKRFKIVADDVTFPSDIYALQSQVKLKGYQPEDALIKVKNTEGRLLEEDIIAAMQEDVAIVVLSSVLYRTGQLLNIEKLTAEAHKRGILIGFDLCHSAGSVEHTLSDSDVDFAFWCTYKHLNGGPGAVGAIYVNKRHFGTEPGLAGWFSSKKETQFDMSHTLTADDHAGAFEIGTPHILSMAPLIGSLELFHEAGIKRVREKSLALTSYLMALLEHELPDEGFVIRNPRVDEERGGHILLEHPDAASICKALKANKVIPDFRAPSYIRLGPVALYNSFEDIWNTVQILKTIMLEKQFKQFANTRDVIA